MKAVIYARYSSDNQREESIEGQLRECTAYCKKNDITILRTYIDRAMSAKTDHRPDFQRMIKDSAKGLFDVIIVWKLDRFARNRYDSAHYKAQLRKYGVKVLSATENISDGPEGIILESMLEGMAEYYSAELSEKVIRGHTENALKCKYNGGTPTFGYIIDKDMQYQIDPCTAPAVLEMFTMYDKGATMKEIVAYMSERGVTTVRGKKIDLNFMARLLKNRKYIGEYSYRHIVTPNGIPAIVPQDLFDRVQQRLAVNRKAPARHKAEDDYLLTTKLFCGTCGAMMVGESGTSSSKGRKYHYYRCVNTKKHRSCDAKHKTVRKLPLENAVVNAVMAKIMDDNFVEYVADAVMDIQSRESSVLPALRKQLEDAESGITNMLNAIQMGIINASTKQRLDELEERKKDIELHFSKDELNHKKLINLIRRYSFVFEKGNMNDLCNWFVFFHDYSVPLLRNTEAILEKKLREEDNPILWANYLIYSRYHSDYHKEILIWVEELLQYKVNQIGSKDPLLQKEFWYVITFINCPYISGSVKTALEGIVRPMATAAETNLANKIKKIIAEFLLQNKSNLFFCWGYYHFNTSKQLTFRTYQRTLFKQYKNKRSIELYGSLDT